MADWSSLGVGRGGETWARRSVVEAGRGVPGELEVPVLRSQVRGSPREVSFGFLCWIAAEASFQVARRKRSQRARGNFLLFFRKGSARELLDLTR